MQWGQIWSNGVNEISSTFGATFAIEPVGSIGSGIQPVVDEIWSTRLHGFLMTFKFDQFKSYKIKYFLPDHRTTFVSSWLEFIESWKLELPSHPQQNIFDWTRCQKISFFQTVFSTDTTVAATSMQRSPA
jgi:hypothetical protein